MTDRRTAWFLFLLVWGTCAFFFGGSGFNQNSTFDQTRAIVERGTLSIDAYAGNTYDVATWGGHIYPNKAPGLSLIAVPLYAPLYLLEGRSAAAGQFPLLTLNLYLMTVALCATSGAAIAVMLFFESLRRGASRRWAIAIALCAVLGTPLFAYSTMLFLHVPSAALLLASLMLAERRRPLAAGAAVGAAGFVNYLCIPAALVVGLMVLVSSDRRARDVLRFVAGGAPFAAVLCAYQFVAFGGLTRTAIAHENPAFLTSGAIYGILRPPSRDALWGLTFSPYRGLFFIAPILVLATIGVTRLPRRMAFAIATTGLYFFFFNVCFNGWHGGYAIGPRYLLPVVPLLALGLTGFTVRWRGVLLAVGIASVFLNLAVTAVDAQPPDSVRNPIGDYILPLLIDGEVSASHPIPQWLRDLYTGHVAVNRVAADEAVPYKLHPPGSPANEWASFNLGESVFGAGELLSLTPVLLWMVAGIWWLLRSSGGKGSEPAPSRPDHRDDPWLVRRSHTR
jgi:hypothetical protein